MKGKPWEYFLFLHSLVSVLREREEEKWKAEKGEIKEHYIPFLLRCGEREKQIEEASVRVGERQNLLSHPSIQTLKPSNCSSCEAT